MVGLTHWDNRPVNLDAIAEPWEAAAIFAEAGDLADPVVLHNTETDGYLAIISQATQTDFSFSGIHAACVFYYDFLIFGQAS